MEINIGDICEIGCVYYKCIDFDKTNFEPKLVELNTEKEPVIYDPRYINQIWKLNE